MTENQVRLTIGALLHDVGKVIYRTGDGRNHSASGKDYLENEVGIKDNLVLESNCIPSWIQSEKCKNCR